MSRCSFAEPSPEALGPPPAQTGHLTPINPERHGRASLRFPTGLTMASDHGALRNDQQRMPRRHSQQLIAAPTPSLAFTAPLDATLLADEVRKILPAEKLRPTQGGRLVLVIANMWIGSGIQQPPGDF